MLKEFGSFLLLENYHTPLPCSDACSLLTRVCVCACARACGRGVGGIRSGSSHVVCAWGCRVLPRLVLRDTRTGAEATVATSSSYLKLATVISN